MTSVVDKYSRRIIQNIDNVRMKFDISSLLVKTKEHDSKINTNESDISDNLSKIDTNESDISDNLSKINANESDISDNLSLINTNKNKITNNYNISQIDKKKSEFNSSSIDNNKKYISEIDRKTDNNNTLIRNNFTSILPLKSNYTIDNIWLFNLNFVKDINFLSNIKKILVYDNIINYQFKVNSFIELNESLVYKYDNIKSYYFVLREVYVLMDQNDIILDEFSFNIKSKGVVFRNIHIYDNQYFFKVRSNITTLKLKVYLERINYGNDMEFNLQLNSEFQNNFIALKYFKYTS